MSTHPIDTRARLRLVAAGGNGVCTVCRQPITADGTQCTPSCPADERWILAKRADELEAGADAAPPPALLPSSRGDELAARERVRAYPVDWSRVAPHPELEDLERVCGVCGEAKGEHFVRRDEGHAFEALPGTVGR